MSVLCIRKINESLNQQSIEIDKQHWTEGRTDHQRYTPRDRKTDNREAVRQRGSQTERQTFIFSMIRLVPRMVYRFSGFCRQCFSAHVVFPDAGRPIIIRTWRRESTTQQCAHNQYTPRTRQADVTWSHPLTISAQRKSDVMAHRKCQRKLAMQFTGTVRDQLVLRSPMYMMWESYGHAPLPHSRWVSLEV